MAETYQSRFKGYEIDELLAAIKEATSGGSAPKANVRFYVKFVEKGDDDAVTEYANLVKLTNEQGIVIDSRKITDDETYILAIPTGHKYTLTLDKYDLINEEVIGHIDDKAFIPSPYEYLEIEIGKYNTKTWAGIKAIVDAKKTAEYFEIGDEFVITEPEHITLVVIGIGVYAPHELTFMSKNCVGMLGSVALNSSAPSGLMLYQTSVYSLLKNSLLPVLPEELQKVMYSVPGATMWRQSMYSSADIQNEDMKIWLPSEKELIGNYSSDPYSAVTTQNSWILNKAYPYFTSKDKLVKYASDNSTQRVVWWHGDGANTPASTWGVINDMGENTRRTYSELRNIPFFFCIRPEG